MTNKALPKFLEKLILHMIRKGFIEHVTWLLAFGYEKKRYLKT
jgi:hypothetical protein